MSDANGRPGRDTEVAGMTTQAAPEPPAPAASETPVIEARNIRKYYGSLVALDNVSLAIRPREIVGLVGDNGAGKSTLVKVLAGAHSPSAGELFVDGEPCTFHSPLEARKLGIETVYQDLALSTELTVAENMYLGRELHRRGLLGWLGAINKRAMSDASAKMLDELGIRIRSTKVPCRSLSGGQRQAIAVARAIAWGSRLLLLDEPTAALGVEQQHHVAELVENVRTTGTSVLLISHNMPQVHALCDRILVLYRGEVIADLNKADVTVEDIVMWITGAALK
jgi:simple sugar transport system ATP-binding protein